MQTTQCFSLSVFFNYVNHELVYKKLVMWMLTFFLKKKVRVLNCFLLMHKIIWKSDKALMLIPLVSLLVETSEES